MSSAGARSMLMIVNPTSGRGRGLRTAGAVADHLRTHGFNLTTRRTTGAGDAERMAREAVADKDDPPGCVVACGGDGTMQEVANALAPLRASTDKACPVMGLAPAGRCNDFARVLGVSKEPQAIAEVLTRGVAYPIDLGRANGRYFCTVVTVGIDAEVSSFVDTMRMPLRGTVAYIYGALRVLSRYRAHCLRISGDFGVIERPLFLASGANTPSYGGAIEIAPDATPTDGELDLCLIDDISKLRALALVVAVLLRRHRCKREVNFIRTRLVSIDAAQRLDLWADGERVACTPATIEVIPGAVRVLLPLGSPAARTSNADERAGGIRE